MRTVVRKEIWIDAPAEGVAVSGGAQYRGATGLEMTRRYCTISSSDRFDSSYIQFSEDNGKTWSEPQRIEQDVRREGDTFLYFSTSASFALDPPRGLYIKFSREIAMPGNDVLEGCKRRKIFYQITSDGGKTYTAIKQLIEKGAGFDAVHYMKGVFYGKNSATLSSILRISDLELLLAVYVFPLDEDGNLYNPFNAYTFGYAGFLLGRLQEDFSDIEWETTQIVKIDPVLSTRGFSEPTLVELRDGKILCICRGNNGARGEETPGGSWYTVSEDKGRTWSDVRRLGFDDGGVLFTPSSMSRLIRHSNGRLYWIANVVPTPPSGNHPRYPLVLARIDEDRISVIRESMVIIDDRQEGESPTLQLSNFGVYEDRVTHEIVVTLARLFPRKAEDWTAPCMKYSVNLDAR